MGQESTKFQNQASVRSPTDLCKPSPHSPRPSAWLGVGVRGITDQSGLLEMASFHSVRETNGAGTSEKHAQNCGRPPRVAV